MLLYLRTHTEHARYTTLSHTWDTNTSFILTTENNDKGEKGNFKDLTQGIAWADIPKTFQEAIKISRELDVDYLWVDSLCIIQNDHNDWKEQSREMSAIYGNSWLNIAATDSKDSQGGCFRNGGADQKFPLQHVPESPNVVVMQQPVHTHKDFGSNYKTIASSPPLLQRGWVF